MRSTPEHLTQENERTSLTDSQNARASDSTHRREITPTKIVQFRIKFNPSNLGGASKMVVRSEHTIRRMTLGVAARQSSREPA